METYCIQDEYGWYLSSIPDPNQILQYYAAYTPNKDKALTFLVPQQAAKVGAYMQLHYGAFWFVYNSKGELWK